MHEAQRPARVTTTGTLFVWIHIPQLYSRLATIREDNPTSKQRFANSLYGFWSDLLPILKIDDRPSCQTRRCRQFGLSHSEQTTRRSNLPTDDTQF